ncbi:MAG: SIR2 family NAD-dependent protein deacylase [Candidatus Hodarchaeales archaeon]
MSKTLIASQPSAGHLSLAKLEKLGKLIAVITQNIDGLHKIAGNSRVYELHGNFREVTCMKCHAEFTVNEEFISEIAITKVPRCPLQECDGILKSKAVLFDEPLPMTPLANAKYLVQNCDLLLILGTSLNVFPAASLPQLASANKNHAPCCLLFGEKNLLI